MPSGKSSRRSFALSWCMLILLSSRGFVRARAWSLTPNLRLHRTSVTRSLAATNSDDEEKTPATGWAHNPPSDDSKFWKKSSESANGLGSGRGGGRSQQPSSSDDSDEPRTGWLHNTESPKEEAIDDSATGLSEAQRLLQTAKMKKELNHRIVSPPAFHACGDGRQVVVTEHYISLPVFRAEEESPRLDVFFSITECVNKDNAQFWQSLTTLSPQDRAEAYVQQAAMTTADDMILYLQGGPGFGCASPMVGLSMTKSGSWAGTALGHYKRIVLMDQRGTGRSTPVTKQTYEKLYSDLFLLDALDESHSKMIADFDASDDAKRANEALSQATDYMAQLRADNIVKDAEAIKDALILFASENEETPCPWGAAIGQSFGGFCMMTYLSQVEHPPKICLLTGGIAPMLTPTYDLYSGLWQRVKERSLKYYDMYPGDIAAVKRIIKALLEEPPTLPSGGLLTARRFLNLGLSLGGSPSAFASLHELISTACISNDDDKVEFTRAFLKRIDSAQSFDDHPLYFLMHESIYGDGPKNSPTNWAANRAYEALVKTPSEFDYRLTSTLNSDERPVLFFGEMVFPWMAEGDFAEVSGVGMRSLADSLAKKEDWGPLYDADHMRKVLQDGSISRAAAAVYLDDMYVDFNACMEVTKRGGPLEKCKIWVSNDYQHSGLRDDGANIFAKLYGMATGSIRTPS